MRISWEDTGQAGSEVDGRQVKVLRKTLSIALVVVGLVVMGLAVASATTWRDSDTVTATGPAEPGAPLVVTEPGVLSLYSGDVTIRATAPDGAPVVLVVGREVDVTGWVGDTSHVLVDALAERGRLAAAVVEGSGPAASPAGSDMWFAEVGGSGEAELEWSRPAGRWSLIAATDGTAAAPAITLTWPQVVSTPYLIPGLVVGALLLIGGVVLGIRAWRPAPAPEPDFSAIRRRLGVADEETEAVDGESADAEAAGEEDADAEAVEEEAAGEGNADAEAVEEEAGGEAEAVGEEDAEATEDAEEKK